MILSEYNADFDFADRWGQTPLADAKRAAELGLIGALSFVRQWREGRSASYPPANRAPVGPGGEVSAEYVRDISARIRTAHRDQTQSERPERDAERAQADEETKAKREGEKRKKKEEEERRAARRAAVRVALRKGEHKRSSSNGGFDGYHARSAGAAYASSVAGSVVSMVSTAYSLMSVSTRASSADTGLAPAGELPPPPSSARVKKTRSTELLTSVALASTAGAARSAAPQRQASSSAVTGEPVCGGAEAEAGPAPGSDECEERESGGEGSGRAALGVAGTRDGGAAGNATEAEVDSAAAPSGGAAAPAADTAPNPPPLSKQHSRLRSGRAKPAATSSRVMWALPEEQSVRIGNQGGPAPPQPPSQQAEPPSPSDGAAGDAGLSSTSIHLQDGGSAEVTGHPLHGQLESGSPKAATPGHRMMGALLAARQAAVADAGGAGPASPKANNSGTGAAAKAWPMGSFFSPATRPH